MKRRIILLAFGLTAFTVFAELKFAAVFNDGAVLQCDMPVNIWGTADPGATVTVSFAGQSKSAVASDSGKWQVKLDPLTASSEPRVMTLASSNHPIIQCSNLMVGEVWLATGQSNMEVTLRNSDGGDERLKMTIPEIRFMKVPRQTGLPPEPMTAEQLKWKEFKPGSSSEIAAVAFYFAEYLQKQVGGEVGIIQCSYGGTPAEAWTPMWALDEQPELNYLADETRKGLASPKTKEQWKTEIAAAHKSWLARREWAKTKDGPAPKAVPQTAKGNPWSAKAPTVLYENMLKPLIPYTARGIIWYQGEGNAGKPDEYRVLFPTMIEAWRKLWNRPDMPFFFVQLSAYNHPTTDWPGLRDAQRFTRDTVPHTGMAVSIDHGEKENIHPRAKQPVGERLGLLALDQVYGRDVVSRGPVFQSLEKKKGKVLVVFQCSEKRKGGGSASFQGSEKQKGGGSASFQGLEKQKGGGSASFQGSEQGLETRDGKAEVPGFEVAGADGVFHPAQARIVSKDTVELSCSAVAKPVSVRYAWHNWVEPPVTLQNSAGLPAEPFKCDLQK